MKSLDLWIAMHSSYVHQGIADEEGTYMIKDKNPLKLWIFTQHIGTSKLLCIDRNQWQQALLIVGQEYEITQ